MKLLIGAIACACISVSAQFAVANDIQVGGNCIKAIVASGPNTAVAVATGSKSAVAISGGVPGNYFRTKHSVTDISRAKEKESVEEKNGIAAKPSDNSKIRGKVAVATIIAPDSNSIVTRSLGANSGAIAAVSDGGFIGVSSMAGKRPQIYTSSEEMFRDINTDSTPELGFVKKFLDLFGL